MSEHNITVEGGASVRLKTAGKYCDRDIVVTASGGAGGSGGWDGHYTNRYDRLTIGKNTFANADYIKSVTAHNCESIEPSAFANSSVETVFLNGGINTFSVGEQSFAGCEKLRDVTLYKCNRIGIDAFINCTALEQVEITNGAFNNTVIPMNIGSGAFYGCSKLKSIHPSNDPICVQSVYGSAFADCSSLESVHFRDCITIGGEAFKNCSKLNKIVLEHGLNDNNLDEGIFADAFLNCTNLTALVLPTKKVWIMDFTAFTNTPIAMGQGNIYVPSSMYEAYRAVYEAPLNSLMPGFFDILFRKTEDYPEIFG